MKMKRITNGNDLDLIFDKVFSTQIPHRSGEVDLNTNELQKLYADMNNRPERWKDLSLTELHEYLVSKHLSDKFIGHVERALIDCQQGNYIDVPSYNDGTFDKLVEHYQQ